VVSVTLDGVELEALFAQTLAEDYESEDAWNAVARLRQNGNREIFDRAAAWCVSEDPLKRARAADILCQLRRSSSSDEGLFRDESFDLIADLLSKENNLRALESAVFALGHLGDERAVPLILNYLDHADADVRFAVAFALGCFSNDPRSVEGLLKLASDPGAETRDWAVFGIGFADADSEEIRRTLLRCLDDECEDVREEAAVGLGKRRDERLIPKLLKMLDQPGLKVRVAEAASALLGLDSDPPSWHAEDYKAAIASKFQVGRTPSSAGDPLVDQPALDHR
jgi:HEAT repeat protein